MPAPIKLGFIIEGDAKGGVKAISLTADELKKLDQTTKRTAKSTKGAFDGFASSILSAKTAVAGLAGVLSVGVFAQFVRQTVDGIEQMRRYSDTLGVSIERFSELEYATRSVGIEADKLFDILKDTSEKIADAYVTGGGEAKEALDKLGLSAAKLAQINPADQLLAIGQALDQVQTRGEKIFILESLANDASLLLPLLEDNQEALKGLVEQANQVGAIFTQEDADIAKEVADNWREFDAQIKALATSFAVDLLPAINSVINGLTGIANHGVFGFISDRIREWQTTAEWWAAYQMDHIGFWEWIGADNEEAYARLQELKREMGMVAEETDNLVINITKGRVGLDHFAGSVGRAKDQTKKLADETKKLEQQMESLLGKLYPIRAETLEYVENVELLIDLSERGLLPATIDLEDAIGRLADQFKSKLVPEVKETKEEVADMAQTIDPAVQAIENSIDRIDDAFADAFRGAFDSFEEFADRLKNAFLDLIAELAYQATLQPIVLNIGASMGLPGYAGQATGGGGSFLNTLGNFGSLVNAGRWASGFATGGFGGASIASGMAGGSSGLGLASGAGGFSSFLSSLAPVLPAIGIGAGLLSIFGGSLFGDRPSPHFGASGGIGQLGFDWERDLDEAGMERAQSLVDTVNAYEQRFLQMLSENQIEALAAADISAIREVHIESEAELASHMLWRMTQALHVLDTGLAEAYNDAVTQLQASGDVDLAGYEQIFMEILAPYFAAMEIAQMLDIDQASAEGILSAAGGLESFLTGMDAFNRNFLSEAQQFEQITGQVTEALSAIGVGLPESREAFKDLVDSLDLASDEGQRLYGALMAIVPAMDRYYTALEQHTEEVERAAAELERQVNSLNTSIAGLVTELYGGSGGSGDIDARISAERSRISATQSAAEELYQTEMRRYEDSLRASEKIGDYLISLVQSSLSPLAPQQQLDAARSAYGETLERARAGDTEALSEITTRSNEFLKIAQSFYASSAPYKNIFAQVQQDLSGLADTLGDVTAPKAPGAAGSSELVRLQEMQREQRMAEEAESRRKLAEELASKIGELGLALDESVFDLMEQFGIDVRALATDFGVNFGKLDATFITTLGELASVLKTDVWELIGELKIPLNDIARAMSNGLMAVAEQNSIDNKGLIYAIEALGNATSLKDLYFSLDILNTAIQSLPEDDARLMGDMFASLIDALGIKLEDLAQAFKAALREVGSFISGPVYPTGTFTSPETYGSNVFLDPRTSSFLGNYYSSGYFSYQSGSHYVPYDMLANIHQGEIIIDRQTADALRRYNISANDSEMRRSFDELKAEVVALRLDMNAANGRAARQRTTQNGLTQQLVTEQKRDAVSGFSRVNKG